MRNVINNTLHHICRAAARSIETILLLQYIPARDERTADRSGGLRSFASSASGFSARRRQCADDNQLLHCWGVLSEAGRRQRYGERGGTVEQAFRSRRFVAKTR